MCENVLAETLNKKIHLNTLLKWLEGTNTKELNFKEITKWNCDRVSFISFFLNYIHDSSLRCETSEPVEEVTPTRSVLFETNSNFVSPLYKPKKQAPKTPPTISLADFITRKEPKKRVQRNLNENVFNCVRRINPTNVSQRQNINLKKCKNSFTFEKKDDEELADYIDRCGFSVEERAKVASRCEDTVPSLPVFKTATKKVIVPSVALVSAVEQIRILACVYSSLLDCCLVVNVTSEMYFVVSMLLGRSFDGVACNAAHVLGTVHNQVFFAVCVLGKQLCFLDVLDKVTVKLLIENSRFEQFADSEVLARVRAVLESKVEVSWGNVQDGQGSVYFVCDTDNRSNFPSDSSFWTFRKQRDMFYDILQAWESQHLLQDWSFEKALGGRVKTLINMHREPCNFIHLVKLFKGQMITSVCQDPIGGETQSSVISSIPNVDAEKLSRLSTRMLVKRSSSGLNAVPIFTGHEEFFKDFILTANSYLFNKHLIDALAAEIVHLNKFSLNSEELNIDNGSVKKLYLHRLKSLRVLAKFLGFLESFPYRSDCNQLSQDVVECQLQIRNQIQTTLNFKAIVLEAVRKKSLTLAVPWLTKYLAMLDSVSLKLAHLHEVIQILFQIYCGRCEPFIIKLTLGWLFDLPHFPNGFYYEWLSKATRLLLPEPDPISFYLDDLRIFDHNVSYVCCPYLDEIKKVLLTDASETNRAISFKHITPVSNVESPSDVSSRRTQRQLEEAFFWSQPDSMKKTVEFVSERVASGCVKEICYDMVPEHKRLSLEAFKNELDLKKTAAVSLENLKNEIDRSVKTLIEVRVSAAIDALLATVVLKETKDLCVAIAARSCLQRVQEWVQTHIQEEIFVNYLNMELKRPDLEVHLTKSRAGVNLPLFAKVLEHNPETLSGVELMKKLQELSRKTTVDPEAVTLEHVDELLEEARRSLTERCDINDCIVLGINRMLLDFLMLIISHNPQILTGSVFALSCILFRESSHIDDLFKTVISPRNQFLLSKSHDVELSCGRFVMLVEALIENDLLSIESFREQCENSDQVLVNLGRMLRINDC